MTQPGSATASASIGYLTNVYPAVSHSFIKREILALEAMGLTVRRWSIRPFARDLPDPVDRVEAERTEVLLSQPGALLMAVLMIALRRPLCMCRALSASLAGRPAGLRSFVVRLAYVAEACLLVRRARAMGVSHIHAHFGTNPTTVVRLARKLGGPTYSFTAHGPDEFDQPQLHDLRGKVADAAFAVGISHYGRSQLMRWADPADWHRIHVVRCGLDDQFLAADHPVIEAAHGNVFACVARLAPQKGLPVLIEAAALLHHAGRDFRILIAGEGDLRGQLEQAIADNGLHDRVTLLGAVSADRVRDLIIEARAFVLPSFAEGLSVSIMEALALERPVITTRIAGIPELVDDGCGRVINAGDAAGLAAAMTDLLEASPGVLRDMGRVGRERVLAAHDITAIARDLSGLFHSSAEHP